MANVQYLNCLVYNPYTGVAKCPVNPGLLQGMIFIPKGTKYTRTQLATLVATLAAAAQQNPTATRVYPVGPFIAFADNSTDSQLETTDYGFTEFVRDGTYKWRGRTGLGGLCLYGGLRKLNGQHDAYDVIYVFKTGLLLTYSPNLTTGAMEAKGISPSLIHVPIWKGASGNTAAQFWIETEVFDASQLADNFLWVQTDTSALNSVAGVVAVDIQNEAVWQTSPAGAIDIKPVVGCDGTNLAQVYGSTWASASLWLVANTATGAAVTVTGVSTLNAGTVNAMYRIQLDTTDTDYPTSGNKVTITPTTLALLYAAGIIGYEPNSLTIARP